MAWWAWLIVGLVLLTGELFVPSGFFVFFFGVSALVMGLLSVVGLVFPPAVQWTVWGLLAIVLVLVLRKPLMGRVSSAAGRVPGDIVGETVQLTESIAAGGLGAGELRGSTWKVLNVGNVEIKAGERLVVQKVDGLTLHVSK